MNRATRGLRHIRILLVVVLTPEAGGDVIFTVKKRYYSRSVDLDDV